MFTCLVSPWLPEPEWCLSGLPFWWLDWLSSMATPFLPVFVSSQLHSNIVEKQKVLNAEGACMQPRGQGAVRSQAYSFYNWGFRELIHTPRLVHSMKSWGCPDVSHGPVIPCGSLRMATLGSQSLANEAHEAADHIQTAAASERLRMVVGERSRAEFATWGFCFGLVFSFWLA